MGLFYVLVFNVNFDLALIQLFIVQAKFINANQKQYTEIVNDIHI